MELGPECHTNRSSQLMILDQETLNKKRSMEGNEPSTSKEDSRDSKKKKAVEGRTLSEQVEADEQPRREK
mgnify:CR=1 FL=1